MRRIRNLGALPNRNDLVARWVAAVTIGNIATASSYSVGPGAAAMALTVNP